MPFDAAKLVNSLDFTLEPYGPNGTVPEPSSTDMLDFQRAVGATIQEALAGSKAAGIDPDDPLAAVKMMASSDMKALERQHAAILDAVARLCGARKRNGKWEGGTPTRTQLGALPHRVLQAFLNWLVAELFAAEQERQALADHAPGPVDAPDEESA